MILDRSDNNTTRPEFTPLSRPRCPGQVIATCSWQHLACANTPPLLLATHNTCRLHNLGHRKVLWQFLAFAQLRDPGDVTSIDEAGCGHMEPLLIPASFRSIPVQSPVTVSHGLSCGGFVVLLLVVVHLLAMSLFATLLPGSKLPGTRDEQLFTVVLSQLQVLVGRL